jgi:hypothetical protein
MPVDGKDEVYDTVMAEIGELEEELDGQLKKFEKSIGYELLAPGSSTCKLLIPFTDARSPIGIVQ